MKRFDRRDQRHGQRATPMPYAKATPGGDTTSILMAPLALMGLMLLSMGLVSAMGQFGF